MFRPRPDSLAATIAVEVEGRTVFVPDGASAAAAVLVAGLSSIRDTAVGHNERAPYCMMGVCFDCLVVIDGEPNQQGCMVPVMNGMRIETQRGPRAVDAAPGSDTPPTGSVADTAGAVERAEP